MKVVVLKTQLKEGLEIIGHATTKSPALPILSNVLLSVKKDGVRLSATDLQMGITYEFAGETKEEGELVFLGHFLASLLAVSSDDQVFLESKGNDLSVVTGNHKATIKALSAEEFPIIPSLEGNEPATQIETGVLCEGLSQVVGMVGQSQARPEISGVLFVLDKKTASVVATDSFRLAERKLVFEKEGAVEQSFILPSKTARELVSTLGERPGKTTIYISPTQAVFRYESQESPLRLCIQIVSRLIEGEYPRYEDIIPSSHKTLVVVQKSAFINHLKAAGVFAGKTQEVRLHVNVQQKEIILSSESAEAGTHQSTFKGEIEGEEVTVAFNWRFLGEGLAQMRGERVEFKMNGEDGPALLRSPEQEGYLYIIMPIKA